MLWPEIPNPLVVMVGPTAVGKTETALKLAEAAGGEIISADSRYLYRGMNIGTAKPSREEMERVPHHLVDVADPDETWSLAVFKQAAQSAIREVQQRGRLPVLVGGTGQYVRAIVEDWEIPQQEPDYRLRDVLEKWGREIGPQELHRRLAGVDPAAAERIDPGNLRRTVRALEVMLLTGRRFSEQRTRAGSPYSLLMIGLKRPRPELYERIDRRIEAMLEGGLVEEVKSLLDQGCSPDLPAFSSIGYREMAAYLQGKTSLEEAVVQMKRLTRQFVRRQANWFKETDPTIHWFDAGQVTVEQLLDLLADPAAWRPPEQTEAPQTDAS